VLHKIEMKLDICHLHNVYLYKKKFHAQRLVLYKALPSLKLVAAAGGYS